MLRETMLRYYSDVSGSISLLWFCLMMEATTSFTTQRRSLYSASKSRNARKIFVPGGFGRQRAYLRRTNSFMDMRDVSASYWFKVGDQVKVVDDVMKAGSSLRNRQGTVLETWEKCDVDPTCVRLPFLLTVLCLSCGV